jgi:PAS domain S-box-containing protein
MKANILIVEDETIVAADLENKLKREGYEVVGITACGEDALDMVNAHTPDLILMDIQLEGAMDGIETAKAIQERQDVPVVYLTAHSDPATLSRAKLTGPFGYILKPFEERDLVIQIELAAFKHQAERQLREQRELLRVTLHSIGEGVIATDEDGLVTFLNPVAAYLTGWPVDEAVGKPLEAVFRTTDEHTGEALSDPLQRAREVGRTIASTSYSRLKGRGGRGLPIECNGAPIRDGGGRTGGMVLVFRDISDRRRAEAEKDAIIEELKDAMGKIKTLSGLLPICAACKKIRDDKGYWNQIELYIKKHSRAEFTHGICPDCAQRLYPKYVNNKPDGT